MFPGFFLLRLIRTPTPPDTYSPGHRPILSHRPAIGLYYIYLFYLSPTSISIIPYSLCPLTLSPCVFYSLVNFLPKLRLEGFFFLSSISIAYTLFHIYFAKYPFLLFAAARVSAPSRFSASALISFCLSAVRDVSPVQTDEMNMNLYTTQTNAHSSTPT